MAPSKFWRGRLAAVFGNFADFDEFLWKSSLANDIMEGILTKGTA